MSDPLREQIVAACITALNTGRPAGIPQFERERIDALPDDVAAANALYPVDDQATDGADAWGPIRYRTLKLVLDSWARATSSSASSKIATASGAWAVSQIERLEPARTPLGSAGLVTYIREEGTKFAYVEGKPVCLAQTTFRVEYQQLTGDMTASQ